jgi:hypothetical protein
VRRLVLNRRYLLPAGNKDRRIRSSIYFVLLNHAE